MKLRKLTNAERILIDRKRRGLSQQEAAEDYGVTLYEFRRWESGAKRGPKVSVGRLQPHEICYLLRRRHEITLADMADELGVSRWWVCQMEAGAVSPHRLINYWKARLAPWRPVAAQV